MSIAELRNVAVCVVLAGLLITAAACSQGASALLDPADPAPNPNPAALSIATTALPSASVGMAYTASLNASGGQAPFDWTLLASTALPAGLFLDAAGSITGVPLSAGTANIVIGVQDANGVTASAPLSLTVLPASPAASPLTIVTDTLPNATEGQAYTEILAATGGIAPLNWALSGPQTLPSGLTLSGAGVISGLPQVSVTASFTVVVQDAAGASATMPLSLDVLPAAPSQGLTILTTTLPGGARVNGHYGAYIAAAWSATGNYSWSVAAPGMLPPGLELNDRSSSTATLEGWPTAEGSFTFALIVTDGLTTTFPVSFTMDIAPAVAPPPPAPPVVITIRPDTLPDATAGVSYNTTLSCVNTGAASYTWKLDPIPAGLILTPGQGAIPAWSATLSGTVAVAGNYDFAVEVQDDLGNIGNAAYVLRVTGAPSFTPASGWDAMPTANAPAARSGHTAIWTGDTGDPDTSFRMIVWGGGSTMQTGLAARNDGGVYNPATAEWEQNFPNLKNGTDAPPAAMQHRAVWTGDTGDSATSYRMIVWGGISAITPQGTTYTDTGGIYDLASDTWTPMTTDNAPAGRIRFYMAWTGATGGSAFATVDTENKVLVLAGRDGAETGGLYDPASDSWTPLTISGIAPGRDYVQSAGPCVWTGDTGVSTTSYRALLWGGTLSPAIFPVNTGFAYDPRTGASVDLSTAQAPAARASHITLWDDVKHRMIVWGGTGPSGTAINSGGIYDPRTGLWSETASSGAPSARRDCGAVWTGAKMIVWGGAASSTAASYLNTGASYDPDTNVWSALPAQAAPAARTAFTMIWTGDTGEAASASRFIVWGGDGANGTLSSGGVCRP